MIELKRHWQYQARFNQNVTCEQMQTLQILKNPIDNHVNENKKTIHLMIVLRVYVRVVMP